MMVPGEKTLIQGLLDEITRVELIKIEYDKMEIDLLEAKRVAIAVDVVGIMRMYEKLKAYEL